MHIHQIHLHYSNSPTITSSLFQSRLKTFVYRNQKPFPSKTSGPPVRLSDFFHGDVTPIGFLSVRLLLIVIKTIAYPGNFDLLTLSVRGCCCCWWWCGWWRSWWASRMDAVGTAPATRGRGAVGVPTLSVRLRNPSAAAAASFNSEPTTNTPTQTF